MEAYQDLDSAEVQARRLERVGAQLASLLGQPEVASSVQTIPGEGEWSVMQVLGHLAEMIPYWMEHCRRLIAAPGAPPSFGRTLDAPERLAGVEHGATGDLAELMALVEAEIRTAAQAIRQMSPAERARPGIHVRHGEMSVAQVIEQIIVAHAEEHLAQIQAGLHG